MNKEELLEKTLNEIFGFLSIKPEISISSPEKDVYNINIAGDDLSFLIGFRGQSLEALQTIVGLTVFKKTNEWTTVVVDINGYRTQKSEHIQNLAKKYVDRVRFFQEEVEMPPMSPWERKQIHIFIADYDDITSESTGAGSERRVVLKPKKEGK